MSSAYAPQVIHYGKFWPRFGAQVLDTLVLLPITLPLSIYNITDWKSNTILIVITLISVAYKPFMEYKYGATLGKMGVQLKVVDYHLQKPSVTNILLRNLPFILMGILSFSTSWSVYHTEGFTDIETYSDYTEFIAENELKSGLMGLAYLLFFFIESVFLWSDDHKRTLHDRLGKTLVVNKFTDPSVLAPPL